MGRRDVYGVASPTKMPPSRVLASSRGDDLLVDAAGRVGVDDFERVLGPGEGVAEAGDVDAGELELGGGVEAGEGRVAAVQPVRDDLRHGVGRGHEAQAHAAEVGDLADRPDAGDLRFTAVGDDDAAARAEVEQRCGSSCASGEPFAARNSSSRGFTPIATITRSASMMRPSAISTPVTWPSSSERTSEGNTPPWTVKPLASMRRPRACPAPSSSWVFMSQGEPLMTTGVAPSCSVPAADSRPSSPPPMVTALTLRPSFSVSSVIALLMAQTSSSVR